MKKVEVYKVGHKLIEDFNEARKEQIKLELREVILNALGVSTKQELDSTTEAIYNHSDEIIRILNSEGDMHE